MAVYTEIDRAALDEFLEGFSIGAVVRCSGIDEGIENTNYRLETASGKFILTLFEARTKRRDLPYFLALMEHLAGCGIPCPVPVPDRTGEKLHALCGRPAAITTFLEGVWPRNPARRHCRAAGRALANLHLAARDFGMHRTNDLSVTAWRSMFARLADAADGLKPGLSDWISDEIDALEGEWPSGLPLGVIHGDLFPDNVFFAGRVLSGLIDFYFACNDILAYDLAICLNAWCFDRRGRFDAEAANALIDGYRAGRAPEPGEFDALPLLARGAAIRFLLTRLDDWRRDGACRKNPLDFMPVVEFHRRARWLTP